MNGQCTIVPEARQPSKGVALFDAVLCFLVICEWIGAVEIGGKGGGECASAQRCDENGHELHFFGDGKKINNTVRLNGKLLIGALSNVRLYTRSYTNSPSTFVVFNALLLELWIFLFWVSIAPLPLSSTTV